jgi:uncharacterized membrane protein YfcA
MLVMAFLPLIVPLPDALFYGAFFTLPVAILSFRRYRRHLEWKAGRVLWTGAVIGTPIGLLLITQLDRVVALRLLGVVLILFPLYELLLVKRTRIRIPNWTALPLGLLSGLMAGTFNIGGPPAILYIYSRPWSRELMVVTLQVLFILNASIRVLGSLPTGVVSAQVAWISLMALLPFLFFGWMGSRLADRAPPARIKQIVMLLLIAMGMNYLFLIG